MSQSTQDKQKIIKLYPCFTDIIEDAKTAVYIKSEYGNRFQGNSIVPKGVKIVHTLIINGYVKDESFVW